MGINMKKHVSVFAACMTALTPFCYGEITLNGFASIVAGKTLSSDETLYRYDNDVSFEQDSLFALQAASDLGDGLSVVAQVMAKGKNDWEPKFEWAYLSYELTDKVQVLAGRQRIPFYMFSDFLDVSYAYNWITPPANIYDIPFSSFNGLGVIYNDSFGEFNTSLHAIYGSNPENINLNDAAIESDLKQLTGAALTLSRDWLTLRAAYFTFEHNIPVFDGLADGYRAFGQNEMANQVQVSGDDAQFFELGFQMDLTSLFVLGEYTFSEVKGAPLGETENFFISIGRQIDELTLHITYGETKIEQDAITQNVPVGLSPQLDGLIAATNGLTNSFNVQSQYTTLGLRWDLHPSAALKFEYTSFDDENNNFNDASVFKTALVTVF